MTKDEQSAAFDAYTAAYDLSDVKIRLKYDHTHYVATISEQIATRLGLSEEDVELAWEIGMLHDIGRFEQLRRYNTFSDVDSIDHAEFGADLLFSEGLLERFEDEIREEYADEASILKQKERLVIIEKAIRNHNKYRLPDNLTERELLFCKIIRDADKIDIFRVNVMIPQAEIYNSTEEEIRTADISEEVLAAVLEGHAVERHLHQTVVDHIVGHLALAFELEFPISRELLKSQGYYEKLMKLETNNPRTKEGFEKICEFVKAQVLAE